MTNENITFDAETAQKLIEEYHAAGTRQRQREIETDILAETVYNHEPTEDIECGFAAFSKMELEQISDAVEDPDKRVAQLLRRPYVKLM